MIDAERWILSEAWIANGLRMRLASGYELDQHRRDLQGEGNSFWYDGGGVWKFVDRNPSGIGFPATESPVMSTADMRHELAHWMVATKDQREMVNFGMRDRGDEEMEMRALVAEQVITSMVRAASRIATLALGGRP